MLDMPPTITTHNDGGLKCALDIMGGLINSQDIGFQVDKDLISVLEIEYGIR